MTIPFYEFEWPVKIVAGFKALEHLAAEMERLQMKRVLLLSDAGLEKAGWLRRVREQIPSSMHVLEFAGVPPDSDAGVLKDVYGKCQNESIGGIVALGGGSVLDSAKALTLMLAHRQGDLRAIENFEIFTERPIAHIAIPTTSGTGSESSHSAVIKDGAHKRLIAGRALYPHVAILDPEIMEKMPLRLAIATGLDAWTHAWEAATSLQSNPISHAVSRAALKALSEELPRLAQAESDLNLRLRLAESATFAGVSFTHSMLGMAHALGHTLASLRPVHHGEAVTLFFLHSMAPLMLRAPEVFKDLLEDCPFAELRNGAEKPSVASLWDYLVKFRANIAAPLGIVLSLQQFGLSSAELGQLARGALLDGPSLFSPYAWTEAALIEFLEKTAAHSSWTLEEAQAWIP